MGGKEYFLNSLIDEKPVAQRKVNDAEKSRRNNSLVYYFKLDISEEDKSVQEHVFKQFWHLKMDCFKLGLLS